MDAFGPALAGADHVVLTDIYAAGEEPIPGVTLDALAAAVRRSVGGAGRRRAARSTMSCRRSSRVAQAGRRRHHARRRVDRHVPTALDRLAGARHGDGARVSPVAVPPIGVSTARTSSRRAERGAGARSRAGRSLKYGLLAAVVVLRASIAAARSSAHAHVAAGRPHRRPRQRAAVEGRSAGGARAGCAARTWCGPTWTRGAAAAGVAVGARRGAPALAAVDGRGVGLRAAADRHRPDRRRRLYLVDERGVVIDEYGPQYADLDLPIIDGLAARRTDDGSITDERRAELAARLIAALQAKPEIARRVSQIDVTRSAQRGGHPDRRSGGDSPRRRPVSAAAPVVLELAPALRARVADIDYVDLRFDDRIYVRPASAPSLRRGKPGSATAATAAGKAAARPKRK